ncbi:hypothetical protein GM160_01880 [Guyparkeria halophila]|uniref:Uncharacterized protein n=1 Tax=Guyparkeria halophila TaxID=47960 RepID=A0A6I6CYM1_9GAMM|nr:hypothetical protein [Guyparkeria halophila]QGT77738.1 hypothetical protein GM160_01880 [Guyparkeria halophila]
MSKTKTSDSYVRTFLNLSHQAACEHLEQRKQASRETCVLFNAVNMMEAAVRGASRLSVTEDPEATETSLEDADLDTLSQVVSTANQALVFSLLLSQDQWVEESAIFWFTVFRIVRKIELPATLQSLREKGLIITQTRTDERTGKLETWYRTAVLSDQNTPMDSPSEG